MHHYGGNAGTASGTSYCKTKGRCDSEKYVADVKATALCGFSDWRMPTRKELQGIAHLGRTDPSIDPTYFPNTPSSFFWSGSPYSGYPNSAWSVKFGGGNVGYLYSSDGNLVRLVRGGL